MFAGLSAGSLYAQSSEAAYWVVETSADRTVIRLHNALDETVYETRSGKQLDIRKKKHRKVLNEKLSSYNRSLATSNGAKCNATASGH